MVERGLPVAERPGVANLGARPAAWVRAVVAPDGAQSIGRLVRHITEAPSVHPCERFVDGTLEVSDVR